MCPALGNHYSGWRRNTCNFSPNEHSPRYGDFDFKKTKSWVEPINQKYFETHKEGGISIERDEMWSYYQGKSNQIWLWWAIDHTDGTPVAFWFGGRSEGDYFALQKLLEPLDIDMKYTRNY